MLLFPPPARAVPPSVAIARFLVPVVVVAVLPSPRAIATECVPGNVLASVVSESTGVLPFTETLRLPPPDVVAAEVFGVGDESVDDVEPEFGGLADATHGSAVVAMTPAPMPNATANAPTRPMYPAPPISVPPQYRKIVIDLCEIGAGDVRRSAEKLDAFLRLLES
jgi:hypothetical protein